MPYRYFNLNKKKDKLNLRLIKKYQIGGRSLLLSTNFSTLSDVWLGLDAKYHNV